MSETLFGPVPHYLTTDDVYTPPHIFERLGLEFDLDVCAPPGGLPWVPARRHYSVGDDGLTAPWEGLVWMNPPYSDPAPWVKRWLAHPTGVAIVPFAKSDWFTDLWQRADALALATRPDGSINLRWIKGKQNDHSVFMPVALVAMGASSVAALDAFGRVR